MPKIISINAAQLTSQPITSFDSKTGNGKVTATYRVGSYVLVSASIVDSNGCMVSPDIYQFTPYPNLVVSGSVSVDFNYDNTAKDAFAIMVEKILQIEGLDLSKGDHLLGQDQSVIA